MLGKPGVISIMSRNEYIKEQSDNLQKHKSYFMTPLLPQPLHVHYLHRSRTFTDITLQQLADRLLRLRWYCVIQLEIALLDQSVQFLLRCGPKGKFAVQHQVQQNTQSPHISRLPKIRQFSSNFRCHVRRSPAEIPQPLPTFRTKPKIDKSDLLLLINKNIFQLDIPMANPVLMTMLNSLQNLPENNFHLPLSNSVVLPQ